MQGKEQVCLIVKSDVYGRMIRDMNPETTEYLLYADAHHRDGWTLLYWENTTGWSKGDIVDSRVDDIVSYVLKRFAAYPRNYQLIVYRDNASTVQGMAAGNPFNVKTEVGNGGSGLHFHA